MRPTVVTLVFIAILSAGCGSVQPNLKKAPAPNSMLSEREAFVTAHKATAESTQTKLVLENGTVVESLADIKHLTPEGSASYAAVDGYTEATIVTIGVGVSSLLVGVAAPITAASVYWGVDGAPPSPALLDRMDDTHPGVSGLLVGGTLAIEAALLLGGAAATGLGVWGMVREHQEAFSEYNASLESLLPAAATDGQVDAEPTDTSPSDEGGLDEGSNAPAVDDTSAAEPADDDAAKTAPDGADAPDEGF